MSKTTTKVEETAADEIELTRYELMSLIDSNATSVDFKKHVDTIKKLLDDHGATIWHEEEWGKRDLAYRIKKQDQAYYLILNFDMDPIQMPKVEEQLRIMNFVLRHLVLKVPANYTPQTYDLDYEEERPKRDKEGTTTSEKTDKPAPVKKAAPVQEAKPVPVEKVAEEVEAPAPKVAKKVVAKTKAETEADLKQLDAKLDELLSNDDDLNL